jgi:hypothetical protein
MVALYVAVWAVLGAAVAAAFVVARGDAPQEADLPPVQGTDLVSASRVAGCRLRTASSGGAADPLAGATSHEAPAGPGVYERAPSTGRLAAALRDGAVVVRYRPGLDDALVERLEDLHAAVPRGTIVVPDPTRMRFEVAIAAYRRVLGCPRLTTRAFDAIRLFRGRFLGSGPRS